MIVLLKVLAYDVAMFLKPAESLCAVYVYYQARPEKI
jgi:hypothetical protein